MKGREVEGSRHPQMMKRIEGMRAQAQPPIRAAALAGTAPYRESRIPGERENRNPTAPGSLSSPESYCRAV